jgi:hypothetical protein
LLTITPEEILQIAQRFGLPVVATQQIAMLGRTVYTFSIGNGRTVRPWLNPQQPASGTVSGQIDWHP